MKNIFITIFLTILSIAGICQSVNNPIFTGGPGNGWASHNYLQPANNIFNGGSGNGWGRVYLPLTPVPVTLLYFLASQKNGQAVLLTWKTSREINSSYFEVQRSNDALV